MRSLVFGFAVVALLSPAVALAEGPPTNAFLEYVRAQAAAMRAGDAPPADLAEWETRRAALRDRMLEAWGGFPSEPCDLAPQVLGTLVRDGYRVEKVVFQTRPGIWMTANAYVPDRPGKLPAVLCVHGHWRGAKQDPVVQARCLGLVKLGFFVLVVDAFGAGERGLGKALGEYHGEMVAATLLPVGLPLCGLQVYENGRAVDYLSTRPEVDPARLGVTGASGGGNQSMYAGAWHDRFAAAVPVCSVGNYQSYLGAACCMCEVVPGALQFTEEGSVLGLTAPRGLMVVNATRDAVQFSVAEAKKSVAVAQPIFDLYERPENLRHTTFESPHDYNKAMREAMYGWMTLHLKGEGDGQPIAEPAFETEDPETLRCYPGDTRPADFVTIPQFAAAEARKVLAQRPAPGDAGQWHTARAAMLDGLKHCLFGGEIPAASHKVLLGVTDEADSRTIRFEPEPGIVLEARQTPGDPRPKRLAVLLDLDEAEKAAAGELAAGLRAEGWSLVSIDLRATGKLAQPGDQIGRAPDHNTAEWSLWLGRPLLGQWTIDVRRLLDALAENDGGLSGEVLVAGAGPAGLVAITSAALDERITHVVAVGTLASYVTDTPYEGQRLGTLVPGILRHAGDVPHLAALVAPRRLVIAGGVTGAGQPLDAAALEAGYAWTRRAYELEGTAARLSVLPGVERAKVIEGLK